MPHIIEHSFVIHKNKLHHKNGKGSYVQGKDAPLRYRLLTDTADEGDQLLNVPLAADFWRLLTMLAAARLHQPEFKNLTVVLWRKSSWELLAENGRFPTAALNLIIL